MALVRRPASRRSASCPPPPPAPCARSRPAASTASPWPRRTRSRTPFVASRRQVGLLALRHRVAHGHVLVALDVQHGELLHRALASSFSAMKYVGWLATLMSSGNVACVAQVLHLALGRAAWPTPRWRPATRVEVRLGRALVHQHEARRWSCQPWPRSRPCTPTRHRPWQCSCTPGCRRCPAWSAPRSSGPRHGVQPAVLVLAGPVVLLEQQVGRVGMVDPLRHVLDGQILRLARRGVAP